LDAKLAPSKDAWLTWECHFVTDAIIFSGSVQLCDWQISKRKTGQ